MTPRHRHKPYDVHDALTDARSEAAEAWHRVERLQWAYDLLRVRVRVESTDEALNAVLADPHSERRHLQVAA